LLSKKACDDNITNTSLGLQGLLPESVYSISGLPHSSESDRVFLDRVCIDRVYRLPS